MSTDIIVSYDGTPNDDDALALARYPRADRSLARARCTSATPPSSIPRREQLAQHDAERRLEQGAALLGDARHTTPRGRQRPRPARDSRDSPSEGATVIVFGSDYRTAPGHAEPGISAQRLLEGGPIAIAVAPAGLRPAAGCGDLDDLRGPPRRGHRGRRQPTCLAGKLGAPTRHDPAARRRPASSARRRSASDGRIALSGTSRARLNSAHSSVLVVPHEARAPSKTQPNQVQGQAT